MAKQKASTKAKRAPQQPVAVKRKRVDISDNYKQSKKARISKPDSFRPTKTNAVKQETQECDICAETRPIYRSFPSLPTCSHDATVCSNCYERQFITKINENREQGWSACTCPLCGEKVEPEDAQGVLPRQVSKELDTMIKNVKKQIAQNWVWCSGSNCGRGQLHDLRSNKVTCKYCLAVSCYKHQGKWHEGFTCDEFDQIGDHDANTAKSIHEIQRTTKPCPHCKTRIKKDGGCNHMICTGCQKHWLWDTVPFDGEQVATSAEVRGGPARHNPLGGGARQAVEQVMRFENERVDNARAAATTAIRTARNPHRLIVDPVRDMFVTTVNQLGTFFRQISPDQQPASRPGPRAGEITERRNDQPEPNQQRPLFARMFDAFANQVRQPDIAAAPVSNMRSTQVGPMHRRQLAPGPRRRQNQTHARTRAGPDPLLVVLDESDVEMGTIGRQIERSVERNQARRGRRNRRNEVIDLTGEGNVIDLTGDD